jgi:HEPN domain-containing protein
MPASDIEILREKSSDYLTEAKRLVQEGKWDLSMIAIHQHCELLLKYYALKLNGSYPRTHSLRELIRMLVKHKKELNDLVNNEHNILKLARPDDAYISSRYFPVRALKEDAVPLLRFVEDVFDGYFSGL